MAKILLICLMASLVAGTFSFPKFFREEKNDELEAPWPWQIEEPKPVVDEDPRMRETEEDYLDLQTKEDVEEEDDEAYANTFRLLDAIMLDEGIVKGGKVEWLYGKGEKVLCKNGKKELPVRCRWTGLVAESKGQKPTKEKLIVISKYCNRAGLTKPKSKTVDC